MEQSIDQLYRLYAKELYWFIFSICKDTDLSDDILQTTFVEAIKSIEKFKGESSVKTWLFSIAKYQCYKQFRKDKTYIFLDEIKVSPLDDMDISLIAALCSKDMFKKIDEINEPNRSIVILRIIKDYSFFEIGELIGKSENYCRVNFYRAKNKLRKELADYE